jgi:hypothetical protein
MGFYDASEAAAGEGFPGRLCLVISPDIPLARDFTSERFPRLVLVISREPPFCP